MSILANLLGRKKCPSVQRLFYALPRTRSVTQFIKEMIDTYEGGFQNDSEDTANWVNGRLIGTNFGITPRTLATHRGVAVETITVEMIQQLDVREAYDIARIRYYNTPGFDEVPWVPATEAWCDFGFLSGPGAAVRGLQHTCGATPDGAIGPLTVGAYVGWLQAFGPVGTTEQIRTYRHRHYEGIVRRQPLKKKYLRGWKRRADMYTKRNVSWWVQWEF